MSGYHRTASDAPFKWRFAGGPMVARFGYWVVVNKEGTRHLAIVKIILTIK